MMTEELIVCLMDIYAMYPEYLSDIPATPTR